MKRILVSAFGIAAIALIAVACGGTPSAPPAAPATSVAPAAAPAGPAAATDSATAKFKCPMPEDGFYANEAGKCPKCGMDLVPNAPAGAAPAAAAPAAGTQPGTQMACSCKTSEPGCDCGHCSTGRGVCDCSHEAHTGHNHS